MYIPDLVNLRVPFPVCALKSGAAYLFFPNILRGNGLNQR